MYRAPDRVTAAQWKGPHDTLRTRWRWNGPRTGCGTHRRCPASVPRHSDEGEPQVYRRPDRVTAALYHVEHATCDQGVALKHWV